MEHVQAIYPAELQETAGNCYIYIIHWCYADIQADLLKLKEKGIILQIAEQVGAQYTHSFSNSLFKDVAYNMMLKSQRQLLHEKLAEYPNLFEPLNLLTVTIYYEIKYSNQLRNYYPLLVSISNRFVRA